MMIKVLFIMIVFIMLYLVAFISNKNYRSADDFLFIGSRQWEAILMFMLPTIVALLMR